MGTKDPQHRWLVYSVEGHGFSSERAAAHYNLQLARFLAEHLGVSAAGWRERMEKLVGRK